VLFLFIILLVVLEIITYNGNTGIAIIPIPEFVAVMIAIAFVILLIPDKTFEG
jgi:hypothetical protein